MLDVVYFVKDGYVNEEFRYSLRSVCQNMQYNRVWVFGGCPNTITPDVHIRVEQTGKTKWDRVRNMFLMACENKELTDDFILFNDDFFIMQPMEKVEPLYRCTLAEHLKVLGEGQYRNLLVESKERLEGMGATTLSYELHVPFVFNKQKLLKMLTEHPDWHCTRTMYGNIYGIGGEKHADVKAFNSRPSFDYESSPLLSTDDSVVNINNDVWNYIGKQFRGACKYEHY